MSSKETSESVKDGGGSLRGLVELWRGGVVIGGE
jgi:hypothetical protein